MVIIFRFCVAVYLVFSVSQYAHAFEQKDGKLGYSGLAGGSITSQSAGNWTLNSDGSSQRKQHVNIRGNSSAGNFRSGFDATYKISRSMNAMGIAAILLDIVTDGFDTNDACVSATSLYNATSGKNLQCDGNGKIIKPVSDDNNSNVDTGVPNDVGELTGSWCINSFCSHQSAQAALYSKILQIYGHDVQVGIDHFTRDGKAAWGHFKYKDGNIWYGWNGWEIVYYSGDFTCVSGTYDAEKGYCVLDNPPPQTVDDVSDIYDPNELAEVEAWWGADPQISQQIEAQLTAPAEDKITTQPQPVVLPTKISTDSETGETKESTTTITPHIDPETANNYGQPVLNSTASTTTKTYKDGDLVKTETHSESTEVRAKPATGTNVTTVNDPSEQVTGCKLFQKGCDFIDWVEDDDVPDEPDILPVRDISTSPVATWSLDLGSAQCPAPYPLHLSFINKTINIDFSNACTFAGYFRMILLAFSYLFSVAIFIKS